tara:strand:- start:428 stop:583 length:156 start_codon:yes stop_codon:yes gene_type:complete
MLAAQIETIFGAAFVLYLILLRQEQGGQTQEPNETNYVGDCGKIMPPDNAG